VSGSYDNSVRIWDLRTHECVSVLEGHSGPVCMVQMEKSGKTVVSSSRDTSLKIWDLRKKGKCLQSMQEHTDWVPCFQFDGKRLISGSYDGTLRVWDTKTGKSTHVMQGHSGAVNALQFDVDGTTLVSGSSDKTVRIWDLKSGKCQRIFQHSDAVLYVSAQDYLFSGSVDGFLNVWMLEEGGSTAALSSPINDEAPLVTISPEFSANPSPVQAMQVRGAKMVVGQRKVSCTYTA